MGAQGSQSGIAFKEEAVWGVNPNGQLTGVNFTAEDMSFAIENQVSNNVRPDRQTSDLIQVGAECSGGFETELQAKNLDLLLPGFLYDDEVGGSWAAPPAGESVAFTIEAGAGDGGLIDVADSSVFSLGQVFNIAGSASNNGIHVVKALPDGTTVQVREPLVTESSVAVVFTGDTIRNGVTGRSFTIERANYDVGQFFTYLGMTPNTLEIAIESGSPLTCKLGFVGKKEELAQSSPNSPSPTDLATEPIMNAVSSIGSISLNDSALAECLLQKIDFAVDNQVEGKVGVGVLGFCKAEAKSLLLKGSISMYFNNEIYYEKYLDSTSFSLMFVLTDTAGNTYIVRLPECKFDATTANVSGKDSDVMVEGTFVAIVDPTEGFTIQITRILV